MFTTIRQLAKFVDATSFEALPQDVVSETKRLLLDSIGCAIAGVNSEKGKWGVDYARAFFGGTAQATVIGFGDKLSVPGAVFVNAELINGLDHDALTSGHTPPFVIPVCLSVAEQTRASGKELITACALAHEISNRIGANLSTFRDIVNGKVSFPMVNGYSFSIFGGTAAVAKLERFTEDQVAGALGMAGHIAPMQAHTTMIKNLPTTTAKYLMAGWISQAEITAAYLVKAGHHGDINILDGDWGYWRFAGCSRWNPEAAVADLGTDWRFPKTACYKLYPCCRIMHEALECLEKIIVENNLRPQEIDGIRAFIESSCTEPVFNNPNIKTQVDAEFSVPYNMAVMAFGIKPGVLWQELETINNPEIRQFMKKVTFEPHPGYVEALKKDPHARMTKVEVSARGETLVTEKQFARGIRSRDPSTYVTDEELVAKFKDNAYPVLSANKVDEVCSKLMALESVEDFSTLMPLLCP